MYIYRLVFSGYTIPKREIFYHRRDAAGNDEPEEQHTCKSDDSSNDADAHGKFLIGQKFHKDSPPKKFQIGVVLLYLMNNFNMFCCQFQDQVFFPAI